MGSEQALIPRSTGAEGDPFQILLLKFSAAAAKAVSAAEILNAFCRETRSYFQVSGVGVWHFLPPDQLVGAEADGWQNTFAMPSYGPTKAQWLPKPSTGKNLSTSTR